MSGIKFAATTVTYNDADVTYDSGTTNYTAVTGKAFYGFIMTKVGTAKIDTNTQFTLTFEHAK